MTTLPGQLDHHVQREIAPWQRQAVQHKDDGRSARPMGKWLARKVGEPPLQGCKALVDRGDRSGVCVAVVPDNCEPG